MKRILVPPGIGDGYWVLIRLRDFMRQVGIDKAEVWIHDAGGPRRSHGMWERCPLVKFGGYEPIDRKKRGVGDILMRAYRKAGHAVQRGVLGFDYFISLNGSLDAGYTNEQATPNVALNWYEPMHDEELTAQHAATFQARFGEYVVVSFWDHGFYAKWVEALSEQKIVETLRLIADAGRKVVVMGAEWDRGAIGERIANADERFVSLIGETDFDQLAGLLSGASGVLGFPAGNTVIGPYFRTPTVLLWNAHFPRAFWRAACPPDHSLYRPLDTAGVAPAAVADAVLGMMLEAAA